MSVYFKKELTQNLLKHLSDESMPAHEKIGAVFRNAAAAIKERSQVQLPELLNHLGVHPNDKKAVEEMAHLIEILEDGSLQIAPTQNTGIYFIQKQTTSAEKKKPRFENVAVFKIGRKRAAIETAARFLAHTLKLDKQMIPGMFCALLDPPLPIDDGNSSEEDETVEELWNGMEKVYRPLSAQMPEAFAEDDLPQLSPHFDFGVDAQEFDETDSGSSDDDEVEAIREPSEKLSSGKIDLLNEDEPASPTVSERLLSTKIADEHSSAEEDDFSEESAERTACAVVGVVQPFLSDRKEASVYEYTLMTMLALAIGLRDGKKDGYKGSTLFDVEDSFPIRMDPVWKSGVIEKSASAIDLPYLDQDPRTTAPLSKEEVEQLAIIVQDWKISQIIRDLRRFQIQYEDKTAESMKKNAKGVDEGGCPVKILEAEPHLINGDLNHLDKSNPKRRVFVTDQLDACNTRLQRMHDFIIACAMQEKTFTPQDLVHAVDKWGKIYQEAIHRSPSLPREVDRIYSGQGSYHITGRRSPEEVKVAIEPSDYSAHADSPPPSELVVHLEEEALKEAALGSSKGSSSIENKGKGSESPIPHED